MNTALNNRNQEIVQPPVIGLYGNVHLISKTDSSSSPVFYNSFENLSKTEPLTLEVIFSDFNYKFDFEITHFDWSLNSNKIVFYINLEDQLTFTLELEGFWTKSKEPTFEHRGSTWNLLQKQTTPLSNFLLSTLWAMLNLSKEVKIVLPEFNYYFTSVFNIALNEISRILQERQIAYRLMIIEKALNVSVPFPDGEIRGEDIEAIAFCYHTIIEREFDWFAAPAVLSWEANQESLSWLPKTDEATSVEFSPASVSKSIFGVDIHLGIMTARIDEAVIDNYEEVKKNLSKLDKNIVNVQQRSLNGKVKMIALKVPVLPQNLWSQALQKLIDLENKLDTLMLERYFNLASSTLEGLTEEQKQVITERPELNEEAFNF